MMRYLGKRHKSGCHENERFFLKPGPWLFLSQDMQAKGLESGPRTEPWNTSHSEEREKRRHKQKKGGD